MSLELSGKEIEKFQATCLRSQGQECQSHSSGDLPVYCAGRCTEFQGQPVYSTSSHTLEVLASSVRMLLVPLLKIKIQLRGTRQECTCPKLVYFFLQDNVSFAGILKNVEIGTIYKLCIQSLSRHLLILK